MAVSQKISQHAINLPPLPTVRDLVKLYRLRALRQLSQNFLMDERITDKIVKAAGKIQNNYVCEVGPGPGSITRSILKRHPKKLILIEKDPRFLPTLELLAEASKNYTDINIVTGNILSYNFESSFPEEIKENWEDKTPPIHLIGNLPFSISTILIINWLKAISQQTNAWYYGRTKMTLTFQKEVAERMVAQIMSKQRCRLSVMCQLWCKVDHKFTIPGKAFIPKPDVDVGVVTLTPLKKPMLDLPFQFVERIIRTMFHMRQKYAIRSGEVLFPKNLRAELGHKLFVLSDIDPQTRPFQITNEEFVRLCYAFKALSNNYPEIENYDFRACKKLNDLDCK